MPSSQTLSPAGTAIELFAGVGGFRIALESAGWNVTWSNQWEPSTKKQHASECYERNFGDGIHVCEDITKVLDSLESGENEFSVPHADLVVGGFPCQDYSVAKSAGQAHGIVGKKGVLWWQIHRLLFMTKPPFVLLENVDRLLSSPASQRGRDFAIILASLSELGYVVEWRIVNAAEYGFPQKRRRVFIVAILEDSIGEPIEPQSWIFSQGILAQALPVVRQPVQAPLADGDFGLEGDLVDITNEFGKGLARTPFKNAGVMFHKKVWTVAVKAECEAPRRTLRSILLDDRDVPEEFFVSDEQLPAWEYLKGAKREERKHRGTGTPYTYSEGAIPFPEHLDQPSRTILTAEGGSTPSRFKHLIRTDEGRYRRLTPVELERLNGFPDGWTDGMPDTKRAFCMGNALVVGVPQLIAKSIADFRMRQSPAKSA